MSTVQRDIHANMRGILVDWLVEVSLVSPCPWPRFLQEVKRFTSMHVVAALRKCLYRLAAHQERCMSPRQLAACARAAQEYKLVSDTLFLAISYVDRFLSMHAVPRAKLQLVGVACMLLAAKYEEIYAPQARP